MVHVDVQDRRDGIVDIHGRDLVEMLIDNGDRVRMPSKERIREGRVVGRSSFQFRQINL